MRLGQVEVSRSAVLVIALLFFLDQDGVIGWVLLAGFLHEMGHWWAIQKLGGKVVCLRLSCGGAELQLSMANPLSEGKMILAALAGPGMNLLLAFFSICLARHGMGGQLYLFAGINLGLVCFNLLPVSWMDGGRALENGFACLGFEELGRTVGEICSKVVLILMLLGGTLLLWQSEGKNFTLMIAGIWLLGAVGRPSFALEKNRRKEL